MSKKLPRIYKGEINKEIKNNLNVYYVKGSNEFSFSSTKEEKSNDEIDINQKINKIFKTGRHSFNIPVEIITKNKVYNTKIAGKIRNNIITLDNDVIRIEDIIDIKEK